MWKIHSEVDVPESSLRLILKEEFRFQKLLRMLVPHVQSEDQKIWKSNTDTYRNNMNDFVLIHLTEDEIYVRTITVYILQFYQLKNPQSFIILF